MKTAIPCLAVALAMLAATCALMSQANAAPPTVTPSPGYDARLQERQKAAQSIEPAAPIVAGSVARHRAKRHHTR
jgi:hypothetical protein